MIEHPLFDDLCTALDGAGHRILPWKGCVYRSVDLEWARPEHLIDGEGTTRHGGRWMMPGVAPVVHASLSEALALEESRGNYKRYGVAKPRQNPRVSVEIELTCEWVLNLVPVEEVFPGLSLGEMLSEDWEKANDNGYETLSQAVGRAAWAMSAEGILTPSARNPKESNIIWFPENLAKGSRVEIAGKKELEKWLVA